MADPWNDDLAALGEHTRHGLRSLAATRASLSIPEQETKMRFFKSHPALAALIALAVLGLATPIAYAVVREVWVQVDADQPAPAIEQSIQSQLQQQGVNATVHADKDDGNLRVQIRSTDPAAGSDIHVNLTGNLPPNAERREVGVRVHCPLDDAQQHRLQDTLASQDLRDLLEDPPGDDESDDELADRITAALADHGFTHVTVKVHDSTTEITLDAPPDPPAH